MIRIETITPTLFLQSWKVNMSRLLAMLIGCLAVYPLAAIAAAPCFNDGDSVTLGGSVRMKVIPPGPDLPRGQHYPLLTLDKPVCLKSENGNTLTGEKVVALISTNSNWHASFRPGIHVRLTGKLGASDNGNQPSEDLLLWMD